MGRISSELRSELQTIFGNRVSFHKLQRKLYGHDVAAVPKVIKPFIGKTIKALEQASLRKKVKIMVGGGAVTQEFADSIGADAYGADAATAAVLAMEFVS